MFMGCLRFIEEGPRVFLYINLFNYLEITTKRKVYIFEDIIKIDGKNLNPKD